MAFLDWPSSWICGKEEGGGEFTLASPCVQRGLIDCLNVLLLAAYVSALLAACVRGQLWDGRGRSGGGRRRWGVAAASLCCVAVTAAYAVAGFTEATTAPTAASVVRGLVWVALAASLHVQPTRPARAVAVLWWTLFSLLVTAYNAEVLAMGYGLDVTEAVAWAVNLLLLLCALGTLLRRQSHGRQHDDDDGLSVLAARLQGSTYQRNRPAQEGVRDGPTHV